MEEDTAGISPIVMGASKRSIGKTVAIVATGALAGVGVVAAAPVFGGIGLVTGVGALVGGLSGAAISGGVAYATDDSGAQADAATVSQAEHTVRLEAIAKRYIELKRMHDAQLEHNDICLELYRVAVACLKTCDAAGDQNLLTEVRENVFGVAHTSLPWHIELELSLIDPPNLASALARAHEVAPEARALVDATVELIAVLADPEGAHGLLPHWKQLRAA